jgi:ectoine hydroxylase-related dioxygenase (phytanoyl-CoA dioxygenase family)
MDTLAGHTTEALDAARRRLDEVGYCVIEGALDPALLERLQARVVEQAQGERAAGCAHLEWQGANQRIWFLLNKGRVFQDLLLHPLVEEMMSHLLGRSFLLSSLSANIAGRGGAEMVLHSDQGYISFPTPRPVVANIAWMLSDFTADNGATLVVPGSHLRDDVIARDGLPAGTSAVAVEGPAGSALVFDGRLWHGTGRNVTDELRYAILSYHCRPFIRQQENPFLTLDPDVIEQFSEELRARTGFKMWAGLGKTTQGQQLGDVLVERIEAPIGALDSHGRPLAAST